MPRILGKNVPCGCEARDEIMFQNGNMSKASFLTWIGVVSLSLFLVWRVTHE